MIVWDDEKKRMVDEETDDYLEKLLRDRENHKYYATLYTREGVAYLVAGLVKKGVKEFETPMGGSTVVRWILKEAWIPSDPPEPSSNFDVSHHLIERLELFLRRDLETNNYTFMPRFEFVDARENKGESSATQAS